MVDYLEAAAFQVPGELCPYVNTQALVGHHAIVDDSVFWRGQWVGYVRHLFSGDVS